MTLDEAIGQFKYDAECNRADLDLSFAEDNDKIAEWLEELKQYRAIGTVKEIKIREAQAKRLSEGYLTNLGILREYQSIGTPEECRAAVEKQKAKKPIIKYEQTHDCLTEIEWKCPTCEENYIELAPCGEWCRYCGTKLDWSDEE